jgi:hypothetical protein
MEARKRTELLNALIEEAHLMMGVLEKAMQGERIEERQPAMHGTHLPQREDRLEDEHKSWGKILRGLTEIHTELEQIEHAERQRVAR